MDKMCEKLIDRLEKALNIKFYEWQRNYFLNKPMLLNMRMTGRCTGKTLVFILKQLFEDSDPLFLINNTNVLNNSDWWCCEVQRKRALGCSYLSWYKRELNDIYIKLKDAGIVTREVIFRKEEIPVNLRRYYYEEY